MIFVIFYYITIFNLCKWVLVHLRMDKTTCYHCGDICQQDTVTYDGKSFCCNGCKTVYEIFSKNNLSCYYDLQQAPGTTPVEVEGKYAFLEKEEIVKKILEFDDGTYQIVNLYIPSMHCSSCIWVLENLNKLQPAVSSAQVNFPKKTVRITFSSKDLSLKNLVLLLSSIGYEPYISLEDYASGKKKVDRKLIYKLAVAGFAFGNIMFLSFPEYFNPNENDFWLIQYKPVFRWLMFVFSLPVVFYSGWDYFVSAFKGLRAKVLNIDVPIALGISALFIRSTVDIIFDYSSGFFDSLSGLIFFLLIGKFFQQRTYSFLSFERDYKSYFPIAVTRIKKEGNIKTEETVQVYEIKKGDRLLIRNEELLPVDAILISGHAQIDYSFVTGESKPIEKQSGDKLFAGGKQLGGLLEIEAIQSVEQSYLTRLWSNDAFKTDKESSFQTITDKISQRFTITVLSIAIIATIFWIFTDISKTVQVFTAVLIIACPCALALAAPFTLGNILRIFGKKKFYLKNAHVIERLAKATTIIFDKTGTITTNRNQEIKYKGNPLSDEEKQVLTSAVRASNHPLSRQLYKSIESKEELQLDSYSEIIGKGIKATYQELSLALGSANFVLGTKAKNIKETTVHVSFNGIYKGYFVFYNTYRKSLQDVFTQLAKTYRLIILSGDNEGEKSRLQKLLPENVSLHFNQKPQDKLDFIKKLQEKGEKIMMVGDGLNDAGALAQSDVGLVVSEDINVFSPASDGIIDASVFNTLPAFFKSSLQGIKVIKWSFVFSFLYNITGLYFAVTGQLSPVIAAILMPLSSISVVVFTTLASNWVTRKIK